jgi:hypothetical protein
MYYLLSYRHNCVFYPQKRQCLGLESARPIPSGNIKESKVGNVKLMLTAFDTTSFMIIHSLFVYFYSKVISAKSLLSVLEI